MKINVSAKNGGRTFRCEAGETILHAGLRHGVALAYACASGTCGSCKVRLISGRADNHWPGAPGGRFLKSDSEILTCQSVPREDCTMEMGLLKTPEIETPLPITVKGRLRNPHLLTSDVIAFDVDLDRALDFQAGQFALITVPGIVGPRAYSIVTGERPARRLSFVAKKKPGGGVTTWLFGDSIDGTAVTLFGPLGHSIFHPGVPKHLLCIGGGSGIAGMVSILRRGGLDGHFRNWNADLFFGVRTEVDVFFLRELEALRACHPARVSITVALSDQDVPASLAAAYPGLAFSRGLVHAVAGERMKGRFADVRAYVAGPPSMVDASVRLLLRDGQLSPADICYDKFN